MSDNDAELDYNASVVMVDPSDLQLAPSDEEDELTIDEGQDPMSFLSVGMDEDDEDDEDEEIEAGDANNTQRRQSLGQTQTLKQCPDCEEKFSTKTSLNIHRLKVHVAGLKNLPCPQCHQEVPDLTLHMRKEHNVDGIVCPHCANIFSKKCTLNRHIEQVHLNIQIHKPATCPICNKVFSKKGHLDRHIKIIHKGIKDYSDPCPYCKKVFTTRASLEPHIAMVHEGVRKKCEICNKVLSDLNKHMRTVHGTYRRKAKIPKDMISEITENPDSEIVPQIFGSSPEKPSSGQSPEKQQKTDIPDIQQQPIIPKQESTPVKRKILTKILPRPPEKKKPPSKKTPSRNNNYEPSITPPQSIKHELDIAQSIKQELGLSSGITLQKIVRPSGQPAPILKGPPKLTYHGPPKVIHCGAIEITPMKEEGEVKSEVDASNNFIPRLVKKPDPSSPSSSVINMNGKYSQKCQS